jgi:hypothetical protein
VGVGGASARSEAQGQALRGDDGAGPHPLGLPGEAVEYGVVMRRIVMEDGEALGAGGIGEAHFPAAR